MKHRFILFLFFGAAQVAAFGQIASPVNDTLRWNATGFTDQNTSVSVQKPCKFITYGSSKIDWVQKDGKVVYTFTVNNVTGNWTDINTDGSIKYDVSFEDFTGSLTITRAGTISISLNIISPDDKIINLYSISNFDIL